jgi:anti-sigma regulatory factor (Ser/Thr protein kinase)
VGFRVMQAEPDSVSLRVPFTAPSAARVRKELLVGNSVRHAHPLPSNEIVVRWWLEDGALALSVSDGGGGRSSPHAMAASMSAVSGRGLSIVDALADRWWVEDRDGYTTVHVHMAV